MTPYFQYNYHISLSVALLVDLVEMCAIALKYNRVKLEIISGFYKFSDIIHFINYALFTE